MKTRIETTTSWRGWVWDGFKVILALGLLGYAISITDLSEITALGSRISPIWLVYTLLTFFMMTLLKALQYNFITGGKVEYFRVLGIVVIQNALSNFVATTAGIASYMTMMGAEKDVRLGKATLSFFIVKMADLIAVLILLVFSLIMSWPVPNSIWRVLLVICAIIISILLMFFSTIIFREQIVDLIRRIVLKLKIGHWHFVDQILALLGSLSKQNSSRIMKLLGISIGISLIYMSVTILWGYARLRTFSFVGDFGIVALITCILQLASWVPVFVFGGLGISESISVYFFGAFGFDRSNVAAVLIAVRVLIYLMNALTLLYLPLEKFFVRTKHLQ